MNKELDALKEARNFRHEKDENLVVIDIDYFNQCLGGIEIKLKALEIIKETLGIELNYCEETKQYIINIGGLVAYQLKGEEEYNLLKEVLK